VSARVPGPSGFGYGATRWWFTEFYAKWHKEPEESHGFDAWKSGEHVPAPPTWPIPPGLGVVLEIERPKERSEGYEYRWGPLLQADLTTSIQANLNLLIEKHIPHRRAGQG
jgi:hypothetical protein